MGIFWKIKGFFSKNSQGAWPRPPSSPPGAAPPDPAVHRPSAWHALRASLAKARKRTPLSPSPSNRFTPYGTACTYIFKKSRAFGMHNFRPVRGVLVMTFFIKIVTSKWLHNFYNIISFKTLVITDNLIPTMVLLNNIIIIYWLRYYIV